MYSRVLGHYSRALNWHARAIADSRAPRDSLNFRLICTLYCNTLPVCVWYSIVHCSVTVLHCTHCVSIYPYNTLPALLTCPSPYRLLVSLHCSWQPVCCLPWGRPSQLHEQRVEWVATIDWTAPPPVRGYAWPVRTSSLNRCLVCS